MWSDWIILCHWTHLIDSLGTNQLASFNIPSPFCNHILTNTHYLVFGVPDTDLADIPSKFTKERSTLPLMFISTPLDKYSQHWTKGKPSPMILQRLVVLAAKSLELVQERLMSLENADLKVTFWVILISVLGISYESETDFVSKSSNTGLWMFSYIVVQTFACLPLYLYSLSTLSAEWRCIVLLRVQIMQRFVCYCYI